MNIVYVLTNPAMPGLVKIGKTTQEDANLRIAELSHVDRRSSAVPAGIRRAVLRTRMPSRRLSTSRSRPTESTLGSANSSELTRNRPLLFFGSFTPRMPTAEGRPAANGPGSTVSRGRRAASVRTTTASNFEEMGIPIGSVLQFTRDPTTVVVTGPRKIRLGEEEMSLTAATRHLLGIEHSVQPSPFWTFNGCPLSEIYEDTYGDGE